MKYYKANIDRLKVENAKIREISDLIDRIDITLSVQSSLPNIDRETYILHRESYQKDLEDLVFEIWETEKKLPPPVSIAKPKPVEPEPKKKAKEKSPFKAALSKTAFQCRETLLGQMGISPDTDPGWPQMAELWEERAAALLVSELGKKKIATTTIKGYYYDVDPELHVSAEDISSELGGGAEEIPEEVMEEWMGESEYVYNPHTFVIAFDDKTHAAYIVDILADRFHPKNPQYRVIILDLRDDRNDSYCDENQILIKISMIVWSEKTKGKPQLAI